MKRILAVMVGAVLSFVYSGTVLAAAAAAPGAMDSSAKVAIALAAAFAIAITAFGAALGQGRMAATAME
ncbi:MAG: F0F1 ATP synthase subunit C, partial [Deltaproteobacteria bacterium]|nr:F0F1 ATP synthase subunit C [Deltaproteobacteria bacterium]